MLKWPFQDPPNVAVFIDKSILEKGWIHYVTHDADDGAWQFHGPKGFTEEADAKVVSLESVVAFDESILDLADLPLGWAAHRETPTSPWVRKQL